MNTITANVYRERDGYFVSVMDSDAICTTSEPGRVRFGLMLRRTGPDLWGLQEQVRADIRRRVIGRPLVVFRDEDRREYGAA